MNKNINWYKVAKASDYDDGQVIKIKMAINNNNPWLVKII